MSKPIANRYLRFAEVEARGRSPIYESLARYVAEAPAALDFLERLPETRRQPNLLFAALRLIAGTPTSSDDVDHALATQGDAITAVMLRRTTQTNEPGRCACLLPALAQIEGPIALIEVGAAAGLCLLPDVYGYDWGHRVLVAPAASGAGAPIFPCTASQTTPLPSAHPEIVWRAGLDLAPLDLDDAADVAWLEHLVWPEDRSRLERLRAAIRIARRSPPRVEKGDLRTDLTALLAEAPTATTKVVFHSAVLSYLPNTADRDSFVQTMRRADAVWLSNEAPGVLPQISRLVTRETEGLFLLARDGIALAWTGPHGQSVHWLE